MAYAFSGSPQSLTMGVPDVIGFNEPLTMACWFNTAAPFPQVILSIGPPDNENLGYLIRVSTNGNTNRIVGSKNNDNNLVTANYAYDDNKWAHATAVFTSDTSRTLYVSKSGITTIATKTTNIADATGTAFTSMAIGRRHVVGTSPQYFNGQVAEVGIWTAALTDDDVLALSLGASPALVRPGSLVFYAPLIRDLQDVRGGLAITNNNGATVSDHPRIYY